MSTKPAPSTNRAPFLWIGLGVVVVVALFVWAIASGGTSGTASGSDFEVPAFGEVTIDGDPLPLLDPSGGGVAEFDPAAGQPAPLVSGTDWNGEPSTVGGAGSQLVVFLAHWCPNCQAEVPVLVDLMAGGDTIDGVPVVAVATSANSTRAEFPPAAWLDREGWTGQVVMDDAETTALRAYGLAAFPAWAVIGPDGEIVTRATGQLPADAIRALAGLAAGG
ncbi:MAG: TlpA disulfide reductase family protein [Acidimicrobiia bacterium]